MWLVQAGYAAGCRAGWAGYQ